MRIKLLLIQGRDNFTFCCRCALGSPGLAGAAVPPQPTGEDVKGPPSLQPRGFSVPHNSPIPKCTKHVVSRQFSVSSSYNHLGFALLLLPGLQINFFLCSLIFSEVSSMVILGEFPSCSLGK